MVTRVLSSVDLPALWQINEQGLPGVGKVDEAQIEDLITLSELAVGVEDHGVLVGFVLCLLPKTRYTSLNYAWFNERYDTFLYVDRIAVATSHRNLRIGSTLYEGVFAHANALKVPVVAEVSLTPPNVGSMRFHARHGFHEVGVFRNNGKAVTMLMRNHGA